MGAKLEKQTFKFPSTKEGSKNVSLRVEICSSWGFYAYLDDAKSFAEHLTTKGFNVSLEAVPKAGGNGEYFLYQILNEGSKKIIFSNDNRHKENGAVVNYDMDPQIYNEIIRNIKAE